MALASAAVAQAPPAPLSGRAFQSPATQALEDDELLNAGMLWVEQGARLWTVPGTGGACAACHGDAAQTMRGVAARHPRVDPASGALFNLERRINTCRTVRQREPAWPFESEPLLALTAYVAHLSKGLPRNVAVDGAARPYFEAGRAFFETRQGQLNLACSQCHQDYAGRKLRGDTISQGQTDGWPAYRLEWQTLGSLQRRLRACSLGVRAEVLPFDAPEYVALELYLAWRGQRLPISAPGVRR
jgi:sulfur-oxidizing protein SoxA